MLVLDVVSARDIEYWPQFDGIWNSHPILPPTAGSAWSRFQRSHQLPSCPAKHYQLSSRSLTPSDTGAASSFESGYYHPRQTPIQPRSVNLASAPNLVLTLCPRAPTIQRKIQRIF
jgi:hypothetical protein